jgi:hypothetical protein
VVVGRSLIKASLLLNWSKEGPAARPIVTMANRAQESPIEGVLIQRPKKGLKSLGNLARTFRATETVIIGPLVRLLGEKEAEVFFFF